MLLIKLAFSSLLRPEDCLLEASTVLTILFIPVLAFNSSTTNTTSINFLETKSSISKNILQRKSVLYSDLLSPAFDLLLVKQIIVILKKTTFGQSLKVQLTSSKHSPNNNSKSLHNLIMYQTFLSMTLYYSNITTILQLRQHHHNTLEMRKLRPREVK